MKALPIVCLALSLTSTAQTIAQSVKITAVPKRYRRRHPISATMKTFVIVAPKVSGLSPNLAAKVQALLSYQDALGLDLKEEQEDGSTTRAFFKVHHNGDGILDITLACETMTAYPDTHRKEIVINLRTGTMITARDAFRDLTQLASLCRKAQEREIVLAKRDSRIAGLETLESAKFGVDNLEWFSVGKKGITFRYDYEFPHAARALEPEGAYFFSWKTLQPYLSPTGPLRQFVR